MLTKHLFLSLALAFAAAGCTKGESESVPVIPGATKANTEDGLRRLESLNGAERKDLIRCMADKTKTGVAAFRESDAYKNLPTTEARQQALTDAINAAAGESKNACAKEFKLDPNAIPSLRLR